MASVRRLVFVTILVGVSVAAEHRIPGQWGTCKRSQPNLDECLRDAIQRAIVDLQNGNADLGVAPLDPFTMQQFHINRGGNGPLNIDMTFSDVEITGLHESTVETVKTDLNKVELYMELVAKTLGLRSKYVVRGRVLLLPINGDGQTVIRMDDAHMRIRLLGRKAQGSDGKDYLQIDSVDFDFMPEKTYFKFINPAHASQADLLSRVVSDNDRSMMQELRPTISQAFLKTFKDVAVAVFEKVPFDEVFPQ